MTLLDTVRLFGFQNLTGEIIPPFACMVVTGISDELGAPRYTIRKPVYDDEQTQDPARIVFNSGVPCPINSWGACSSDFPAHALVDETSGAAVAQVFGPVSGSWALGPLGNAFVLKAKDTSRSVITGSQYVWIVELHVAEVEVVRVTTNTPDGDGYYAGFVQRFDKTTKTWYNVRACRVRDANQ
jgi:hypothetical protein